MTTRERTVTDVFTTLAEKNLQREVGFTRLLVQILRFTKNQAFGKVVVQCRYILNQKNKKIDILKSGILRNAILTPVKTTYQKVEINTKTKGNTNSITLTRHNST